MSFLRNRKVRLAALCIVTAFTLFRIQTQWVREAQVSQEQRVPPEGKVPDIDTKGEVPGDPANAVEDMKKIHTLIGVYERRHKQRPRSIGVLFDDVRGHPRDYGFSSKEESYATFTNPDARYADGSDIRAMPDRYVAYIIDAKRPDGTPTGGLKAPGTRDILLSTHLYFHGNIRHYKNTRSSENPVGFYVVMWDDGEIEKISYDKQIYVPLKAEGTRRTFKFALPGQAGVPDNALTYDQYYQQLGWKKGPRGTKGGKGQTFDGRRP